MFGKSTFDAATNATITRVNNQKNANIHRRVQVAYKGAAVTFDNMTTLL
jgi:hypothetical protein